VRPRPLAAITGASSGIGEVFARKLAARGYDLLLIARRKDRLEALVGELATTHNAQAEFLVADLTSEGDLARTETRLREEPRLEFLVNNAGFGTSGFFHDAKTDGQDTMHSLHVMATMRLTRAALPGLVGRKKGFIVNVSSVAGFVQSPHNVSYCATKAWMNSFSEGLYLEMRALGVDVRVQALCPGYTYTEFHQTMGLSRDFAPKSWWMSADEVVEASLRGLEKNQLFVIPGMRYKLIVAMLKHLPKRILHASVRRSPSVKRAEQRTKH
jgi:short-subunit dehydrogenase